MAWKVGVEQLIAIDLGKKDIYGASGFNVIISNPSTGETLTFEDALKEEIIPIDDLSSNVSSAVSAGDTAIPVDDASNWKIGYVARVKDSDGNIQEPYFYVIDVDYDNNVIYVRENNIDIAQDSTIFRVGNTGIYAMSYTPDVPGKYLIVINNPSIGLYNHSKSVEVLEHNEDDIYNAINDSTNTIITKLDNIIDSMTDEVTGEIIV